MAILYFFGAAAGGFVLMSAGGIQALVAFFSFLPLARRRKKECPDFDLKRAYRRMTRLVIFTVLFITVITILVIRFASVAPTLGYLFGMILALVMNWKRMSPNNAQNQRCFEKTYADCYPPPDHHADDFAAKNPQEPSE